MASTRIIDLRTPAAPPRRRPRWSPATLPASGTNYAGSVALAATGGFAASGALGAGGGLGLGVAGGFGDSGPAQEVGSLPLAATGAVAESGAVGAGGSVALAATAGVAESSSFGAGGSLPLGATGGFADAGTIAAAGSVGVAATAGFAGSGAAALLGTVALASAGGFAASTGSNYPSSLALAATGGFGAGGALGAGGGLAPAVAAGVGLGSALAARGGVALAAASSWAGAASAALGGSVGLAAAGAFGASGVSSSSSGPSGFDAAWLLLLCGSRAVVVAPTLHRDQDAYDAVVAALLATGEFASGDVRLGYPEDAARLRAGPDPVALVVRSHRSTEKPQPDPMRRLRVGSYRLVLALEARDASDAEAELDRLFAVCHNALDSQALGGFCLFDWSCLERDSYDTRNLPDCRLEMQGRFAYEVNLSIGGYRTTT